MYRKHLIGISSVLLAVIASINMAFADDDSAEKRQKIRFENISAKLGHKFEMKGESFMPGVGFLDYNNDSHIDIYVANGVNEPNALFRNNGNGTFTDVAASAGVADIGYTTGIAVGDINNDGYDDLYVAQQTPMGDGDIANGPDRIYVNNGNGTFREVAVQAGINESGFTTSVAFLDYNGDGKLDILVGRMIDMDIFDPSANRTNPTTRTHLYRNNGNLTFTDVTESVDMGVDFATWAVAAFDYDNDGDMDIFLGHEQGPISVLKNDGNGHFENATAMAGDLKDVGAWMGIAVGDYNNDGLQDIYASNISDLYVNRDPSRPAIIIPPAETWDNPWPTLFRNNGDGSFTDVGEQAGVKIGVEFSWGTMFVDVNNDGWQDIYLAQNFSPVGVIGDAANGAGPGRLFINKQDGTFVDVSSSAGVVNYGRDGSWLDARGTATADINKDGLMDFYLVNSPQYESVAPYNYIRGSGMPYLFKNKSNTNNSWLQVRLIGRGTSGTNAIGAKVTVTPKSPHSGAQTQTRELFGGGSVYSQSERMLHFGLKSTKKVDVKVQWPNGIVQTYKNVNANKRITLVQGCTRIFSDDFFEKHWSGPLKANAFCSNTD